MTDYHPLRTLDGPGLSLTVEQPSSGIPPVLLEGPVRFPTGEESGLLLPPTRLRAPRSPQSNRVASRCLMLSAT
jgi:hypothetical protein